MTIDTKTVEGRRELEFNSLDDLKAELDKLSSGEVKTLGNWSLAQIYTHLAAGLNSTLDGSSFKPPFFFKLLAPFMKKKFLTGKMPPGFKIPKNAESQFLPPDHLETQAGLDALRIAIDRVESASESDFVLHPMFGKLSKNDAIQFHLRHAEMHLSFAIPN